MTPLQFEQLYEQEWEELELTLDTSELKLFDAGSGRSLTAA